MLWDNGEREKWRQERLNIGKKIYVHAPIRYGRRSQSRGDTFTMTFARSDHMGRAVLVLCRAPIGKLDSLVAEAEALWKAEGGSTGNVGASWGCVGVLFRQGIHSEDLREGWAKYFTTNPVPPVDKVGKLDIPWPTTLNGSPADVDVILATATQPEARPPTAKKIADAWLCQSAGHERYFFENVRHGIRTPDDGDIWRRFKEKKPDWLKKAAYAKPIKILEGEATRRG